jgi:hypothetical protein
MSTFASANFDIRAHILRESEKWHIESVFGKKHVTSVMDFSKVASAYFRGDSTKGGKWVFRGESRLFNKPITPSIFRDVLNFTRDKHPAKSITDQEIVEVEKCKEYAAEGRIKDRYLRAFLPDMHNDDVNWLPLAQHFGFKTRLLDVTLNSLVALYFACETPQRDAIDENEDAFVYAFLIGNFRPINAGNTPQRTSSDFPPIPTSYLDLYDVDRQFDVDYDGLPYIFEPSIPQERLQAQAGRFLFWRKLEPVLHNGQIIPIPISAAEKMTILSELSAFGITRKTLFPSER